MSPLRKQTIFTKRVVLDEIFIFRDSVILEYQLIEKDGNIAKRNFFGFECFESGLNNNVNVKHFLTLWRSAYIHRLLRASQ